LEAGQLRDMVSNYSMARQLAHYQQITGDWRYIMTSMNHYRSITPEQIQRVARKYFKHSNVTVATLKKKI
jgi:predicted Zn-dependent peptidase